MNFCEFCLYYKTTSNRFQDGICDKNNKNVKGYEHSCEHFKDGCLYTFKDNKNQKQDVS